VNSLTVNLTSGEGEKKKKGKEKSKGINLLEVGTERFGAFVIFKQSHKEIAGRLKSPVRRVWACIFLGRFAGTLTRGRRTSYGKKGKEEKETSFEKKMNEGGRKHRLWRRMNGLLTKRITQKSLKKQKGGISGKEVQ